MNQRKRVRTIETILKSKRYESLFALRAFETILRKKRGYVIARPKPDVPAILLMSGGLDSICIGFYLLKRYNVPIYPLYIRWDQKNLLKEEEAVRYFSELFTAQFPKLFHNLFVVDAPIPARALQLHDDVSYYALPLSLRNSIFLTHAVHYANYLEKVEHEHIRTIYINSIANDSLMCPDASLTAIRAANINLCFNEGDFSWQYTSIALERTLGMYKNKDYFIRYASKYHLPIEKTWSCETEKLIHCGECKTCHNRKDGFAQAGIPDKTIYYTPGIVKRIMSKMKKIIKNTIY